MSIRVRRANTLRLLAAALLIGLAGGTVGLARAAEPTVDPGPVPKAQCGPGSAADWNTYRYVSHIWAEDSDGSCWACPGPVSQNYGNNGFGLTLAMQMAILHPTPTVNGNNNRKGASEQSGNGLGTFVKKLCGYWEPLVYANSRNCFLRGGRCLRFVWNRAGFI